MEASERREIVHLGIIVNVKNTFRPRKVVLDVSNNMSGDFIL